MYVCENTQNLYVREDTSSLLHVCACVIRQNALSIYVMDDNAC